MNPVEGTGSAVADVQARIHQIRTQFARNPGGHLGSAPVTSTGGAAGDGFNLASAMSLAGDSPFGQQLADSIARIGTGATTGPGMGTGAITGGNGATNVPTSGTVGPSGVDHVRFARDLLTRLQLPVTSENVRLIDAWAQAEGTRARFNPLATTQPWPGATEFNSVGVRNFASYEDGVAATVRVITNGRYGPILDSLRAGNDAEATARAIAASPWGSGELVLRVLQSQ